MQCFFYGIIGTRKGVSAIEQSLGMNLSQHLAMTMQLQQAIEDYLAAGGDRKKVEAFIQKPDEE